MNPPPQPAHPPHSDEHAIDPDVERRAVGRRSADRLVVEELFREHEEKLREREEKLRERNRALVWKLAVPGASLLVGWLLAMGFGYTTPSARLIAAEQSLAALRAEQATTRRQLTSLLIIRCLDTNTSREILIAAGVNCEQLMRDNGLR